MPFWRGETLQTRLPALVSPFDPAQIDCAAYTLTLGDEVFVTSDLPDVGKSNEGIKTTLSPGQQIRITPGQFAFLRTRETIEVPANAVAFISIKAKYKFRGLINVSGFHVDPGYKDHLLFSVYNAGPAPVVLSQGMSLFLIWYADLDGPSQMVKKAGTPGKSIDSDLISNMSGQVFSPIALNREVSELRRSLLKTQTVVTIAGWAATAVLVPLLIHVYTQQSDLERELTRRAAATTTSPAAIINIDSRSGKVATPKPEPKTDKTDSPAPAGAKK